MRTHHSPLRVLLAALLAAGSFPSPVFADPTPVEKTDWRSHSGMRVNAALTPYRMILIPKDAVKDVKPGDEVAAEALIPVKAESAHWLIRSTFNLTVYQRRIQLKRVKDDDWQIKVGETWQDTKMTGLSSGWSAKFEGVWGYPTEFNITRTADPNPPPASTPAPGEDFAGPFPWRSAPINDSTTGVEHRKCKREECACTGDSCKGKRINLYAVTKAEKAGDSVKFTMTLDAANYLTSSGGKWNMCWDSGTRASVPVATMGGFPDSKFLPDATYWVKGANSGGDFKGVKKAEFSWTGSTPAKPKDTSPECAYGDAPETAPPPVAGDELDKKLDEIFKDKVERAGADWLAESYGGKTGPDARKAFLDALNGSGSAAAVTEVRGKVRKEIAGKVAQGKPESVAFIGKRGVTKEDLQKYICDLIPEEGGAAAPTDGATSAKEQLGVVDERSRAAAASTSDAATRGDAQIDERSPAAAQAPAANLGFDVTPELKTQCAIFRSRPAPGTGPIAGPGTGAPGASIPSPHGQQVTPDAEAPSTAAADAKKKKDLQRMAIGGAGGALVLGVFGFIFGGPIGALAMGALGFGLMAGVTYMNNNPIK